MACTIYKSAAEAIFDVKDDTTILLGGFGLCGIPENLGKGGILKVSPAIPPPH